jgi:hypothetical protein
MPRLGDDVSPGGDLRFKVTHYVAAGEGACARELRGFRGITSG